MTAQFGDSFGANEWLVEEMYERFLADPNSVDAAWHDFFKDFSKSSAPIANNTVATKPTSGTLGTLGTLPGAPKGGQPPLPKSAAPVQTPVQAPVATPSTSNVAPVPAQPMITEVIAVNKQPTPKVENTPVKSHDMPAQAPAPAAPQTSPGGSTTEPIRGVGARVVQSMEASLSVPTATSVRAVPAKLMIDNRIVINSHLKRARGGKVSFTHIIGYAMIKALRQMPEMNYFYAEVEGKPAVGKPEHVNLGIAIDLAKPNGERQLLVPSIKGCENLDFAQFWASYEETIRKARSGALTVEDFAGTTVSLTNPGTIGTVHSVPRLVQGQALILGVGAMDYLSLIHI